VREDIFVAWFEPAPEGFVTRSGWIRVRSVSPRIAVLSIVGA